MATPRPLVLALAVAAAAGLTGCGSAKHTATHRAAKPAATRRTTTADAAAVRVIRAWARTLRAGDVHGAARYFALPSLFANGVSSNGRVSAVIIRTAREAEAINASLPCGAAFVSAIQAGRYVNVLFRLTDRPGPGGGCGSGIGQTARTNFVVRHGRIVQWIRAPDQPGAQPAPVPQPAPSPSPTGAQPATPVA